MGGTLYDIDWRISLQDKDSYYAVRWDVQHLFDNDRFTRLHIFGITQDDLFNKAPNTDLIYGMYFSLEGNTLVVKVKGASVLCVSVIADLLYRLYTLEYKQDKDIPKWVVPLECNGECKKIIILSEDGVNYESLQWEIEPGVEYVVGGQVIAALPVDVDDSEITSSVNFDSERYKRPYTGGSYNNRRDLYPEVGDVVTLASPPGQWESTTECTVTALDSNLVVTDGICWCSGGSLNFVKRPSE